MLGCVVVAAGSAMHGCAAPAAMIGVGFSAVQVGTEAFSHGKLSAATHSTLPDVWIATLAAVEELALDVRTRRLGRRDAYIMAQSGGPEFKIRLESKSPEVTKIEIRVGIVGDVSVSRLMLATILAKLTGANGPVELHTEDAIPLVPR